MIPEPLSADVVVVGSGSGGAVVARRLVDAGVRVVLVETGGADENPAIHDPPRLSLTRCLRLMRMTLCRRWREVDASG